MVKIVSVRGVPSEYRSADMYGWSVPEVGEEEDAVLMAALESGKDFAIKLAKRSAKMKRYRLRKKEAESKMQSAASPKPLDGIRAKVVFGR